MSGVILMNVEHKARDKTPLLWTCWPLQLYLPSRYCWERLQVGFSAGLLLVEDDDRRLEENEHPGHGPLGLSLSVGELSWPHQWRQSTQLRLAPVNGFPLHLWPVNGKAFLAVSSSLNWRPYAFLMWWEPLLGWITHVCNYFLRLGPFACTCCTQLPCT